MNNQNIRHIITRLSLAVVFLGIGIWEILQPAYWSTFFPQFLTGIAPINTLIMVHGIVLIVIGLAVLLGAYLRIASGLAVLMMLFILFDVISVAGFTDIVIRDLAVLLIALALFFDDTKYLRLRG